MNYYDEGMNYYPQQRVQRHVHELQGIVRSGEEEDPHSHRFCTVTGEEIPYGANDHVHEVTFLTDFYDDHYHGFQGVTGGTVKVDDRHVHFLKGVTTFDHEHSHEFEAATMINNPGGAEKPDEEEYYGDEYPYREDHYQWYE